MQTMSRTNRWLSALCLTSAQALTFALLSSPPAAAAANTASRAESPDVAGLQSCLKRLGQSKIGKQTDIGTYRSLTQSLTPDPSVLEKLNYQPEFVRPVWEYMAVVVDDERIANGKEQLNAYTDVLATIGKRFGVQGEVVLAIWGVESDYGRNLGKRPLLQSLATLACYGRRQKFFSTEFLAAIKIAANGDIAGPALTGSWAGAFGHTQFMPSTFLRTAVDYDGDGRRDLMGSVPDALASAARYLQKAGWQTGQPWGMEVSVPPDVEAHDDSRTKRKPLSEWRKLGVKAMDAASQNRLDALDASRPAALVRPAVTGGPTFVVFKNFDAIFAYNPSVKYALAIAHLSDRVVGGSPFITPWPTEDKSLSRSQSKELQALLLSRGYDIGGIDGIIGPATRRAVRAEQSRLGLKATGYADQSILETLQRSK